jgi:hypothetical protein
MIDRSHVENGAVKGDTASTIKRHATERESTLDADVTNDVPPKAAAECAGILWFLYIAWHDSHKNGGASPVNLRTCRTISETAQIPARSQFAAAHPLVDDVAEARLIEASLS